MRIVIRNYLSGSDLLDREPDTWDAIVILDPGLRPTEFVERRAKRHIYLHFDDVASEISGRRTPTVWDVRAAIDFATNSESLMVCCRAGQSRSAAMAFVICHHCTGPEAARRLLDPRRHSPNALIVQLGAQELGDPTIVLNHETWLEDNRHVVLSDHFDDIEREFDALEARGAQNLIVDSGHRP